MNVVAERQSVIVRDDEIFGGIPVFAGTRVPIKTLLDYLTTNYPLDDFPTVQLIQAQAVFELISSIVR